MLSDDFLSFLDQLDYKLKNAAQGRGSYSHLEHMFGRVAKLTEEVGELANAVLISEGAASERKLAVFDRHNLEQEFGDVIICACLLAREAGIDINSALKSRKDEIEERWK